MEIQAVPHPPPASSSPASAANHYPGGGSTSTNPSWWESISKARARIQALAAILSAPSLSALADSDRPALSLLRSPLASSALSAALSSPSSGSGADPLCQWLYDTFLSGDADLRLVVLSFLPLLSGLYLSRIFRPSTASPSLAGFEAVLLVIYSAEVKLRNGKPLLISIPDLSQASLYHSPRSPSSSSSSSATPSVAVVSEPLEPHLAVKSTKRACIVGVGLECYCKKIAHMPDWSKLDLCEFAAAWAGQNCPCRNEFDREDIGNSVEVANLISDNGVEGVEDNMRNLEIEDCEQTLEEVEDEAAEDSKRGARILLPWELLQPLLRILGHCLLAPMNGQDVKDAAALAVRSLYARSMHDLVPQSILATRSLIHLDKSTRSAAKEANATGTPAVSNPSTPSKPKKPEMLLVSK